MVTRIAARYVSQRLSSGGKVLSKEEKVAENVYIKKMEQERLAKAARKGVQSEEIPVTGSGGPVSDAKPSGSHSSTSTSDVPANKYRNYAVVGGVITALGALGWYLKCGKEKPEEVQE